MKSVIIIPARLESARLPRKMLLRDTGKTLIQHTYEAAKHSTKVSYVCVATDSYDIRDEVDSFGGLVFLTGKQPTGTDRVAEVAQLMSDVDIIVNLQGDEPEVAGSSIDLVIELLEKNPQATMSTLATPIHSRRQLDDPACVKVVFDDDGRALYFGRSLLPYLGQWELDNAFFSLPNFYQHVGLYAYRREFLLKLASMPPSSLEQTEKLEQLRVLQAGYSILVGIIGEPTFGIDTPEDYQAFVERFNGT